MRSILAFVAALALVTGACGAPDTGTALAGGSSAPASVPSTSAPAGSAPADTAVDDRPVAPDFTLALGNGGTFTLSAEQRPVYMVFWAEW